MKLHPRVTGPLWSWSSASKACAHRRAPAERRLDGWLRPHTLGAGGRGGVAEDADALLYYDLSEVAEKLEAWTFTPLNQNQFEALTAFAFNIGVENFRRSTVLKRVNEGQHLAAARRWSCGASPTSAARIWW